MRQAGVSGDMPRIRIPYMVGVYLGVNAVSDAYLVVDGPDCSFFKAEFVFGSHDLGSDLLDCAGLHRIAHTGAHIGNIALDRDEDIAGLLLKVASHEGANVVLVCGMPMASITGCQYDRIGGAVSEQTGKTVIEVPSRSLEGDWMDGYSAVIQALAEKLPLEPPGDGEDCLALVGMLVDRSEADRMADVIELERVLSEGLGVGVASVWPSNRSVGHLAAAGRAATVVSLPYGREAGRALARRTGAELVETGVPFGIDGTAAFLREVARATGRTKKAESFIEAESSACAREIDAISLAGMSGKGLAWIGDPFMGSRFPSVVRRMGARQSGLVSTTDTACEDPEGWAGEGIDLCVTPSSGVPFCLERQIPFYEYGFPSYGCHSFVGRPTLGFRGVVSFARRLLNRSMLFDDLRSSSTIPTGPCDSR